MTDAAGDGRAPGVGRGGRGGRERTEEPGERRMRNREQTGRDGGVCLSGDARRLEDESR